MALLSGIRLIHLDENRSVSKVPFRWLNKNPFDSMYFAVQSMAAELSTAAPVILALKGIDVNVALIITELKVDFVKKARSKVIFTCRDYRAINTAVTGLKQPGDTATVTVKSIGRDMDDDEVATFNFTWSFKVRP